MEYTAEERNKNKMPRGYFCQFTKKSWTHSITTFFTLLIHNLRIFTKKIKIHFIILEKRDSDIHFNNHIFEIDNITLQLFEVVTFAFFEVDMNFLTHVSISKINF